MRFILTRRGIRLLCVTLCLGLMAFVAPKAIQLTWGEFYEGQKKGQSLRLLHIDGDEAYFWRTEYGGIFSSTSSHLDVFSIKNLRRIKTNPIVYPEAMELSQTEQTLYMNGYLYFFESLHSKTDKTTSLSVYRMDSKGKFSEGVKIEEISEEKRKNRSDFDVVVSNDSTKILVYSNEIKEQEKFNFQVYDRNLALLWSKNVELPYDDNDLSIKDYIIDNKGDVFMLTSIDLNPEGKVSRQERKTVPQYKYSILHYQHEADEFREFNLELKNKFINDITFGLNSKGDLVCAGYYSNELSSSYHGSFYMLVDRDSREIVSSSYKDFPSELVVEFIGEKKAAKGRDIGSYTLRNFVLDQEGGALLVSEDFYIQRICTRDAKTGAVSCTYHYYYNDILITRYDESGEVQWYKRIPKRQHTVNDNGAWNGYHLEIDDDKLHFIFNEEPKNLNPKDPSKLYWMKRPKKAVLVVETVESDGKSVKEVLVNNKEDDLLVRPRSIESIGSRTLLLYDSDRKNYRLGAFKF